MWIYISFEWLLLTPHSPRCSPPDSCCWDTSVPQGSETTHLSFSRLVHIWSLGNPLVAFAPTCPGSTGQSHHRVLSWLQCQNSGQPSSSYRFPRKGSDSAPSYVVLSSKFPLSRGDRIVDHLHSSFFIVLTCLRGQKIVNQFLRIIISFVNMPLKTWYLLLEFSIDWILGPGHNFNFNILLQS